MRFKTTKKLFMTVPVKSCIDLNQINDLNPQQSPCFALVFYSTFMHLKEKLVKNIKLYPFLHTIFFCYLKQKFIQILILEGMIFK